MAEPVVSVCVITYQHANFIAKAIDGALMQRTEFPVEILVGEDESTDGTRQICLDYARKNPDRIRVFLRSRKDVVAIDGRPRGGANLRATIREAKGEYVALCEGDDYWTDPEKLQRQVEFLRRNPDCVGCFHDTALVDAKGGVIKESYFTSSQKKFDQRAVIESLMSSYPTCSLVFRRAAFDPLPDWFMRRPCDLYIDIHLTSSGSLGFIDRNMGAYRRHAGGIWSGQREANQIVELIIRYKLLLAEPFFLERYGELLLLKIDEFQNSLFTRGDYANEISRLEKIAAEQVAHIAVIEAEKVRLESERNQFKAQLDLLAETAGHQTEFIDTLKKERDRHATEARQSRSSATKSLQESQQHIDQLKTQLERVVGENKIHLDGLKSQVEQLAGTVKQQATYISKLIDERDGAVRDAKRGQIDVERRLKAAQGHIDQQQQQLAATVRTNQGVIDGLRAQLDQVAATSVEQDRFITILKQERARLEGEVSRLSSETAHYGKVMNEQSAYIAELKRQQAELSQKPSA